MENAWGWTPQGRIEERKNEVRSSQREEKKEREGGEREEAGLDFQADSGRELSTRRSKSVLKGHHRQTLAANVTKVQKSNGNYVRELRKATKPVSFLYDLRQKCLER